MFAQPLRGVGPGGIPVAVPDAAAAPFTEVTHYSFTIGQFTNQLHPNLGPALAWERSADALTSLDESRAWVLTEVVLLRM